MYSPDNKSLFGVCVLTDLVASPCNKSAIGARCPSGVPLENCKIDFVIELKSQILIADNKLAKLVSGRHECCWQGFRTNFSISWFKPSTELRIGLVCGGI